MNLNLSVGVNTIKEGFRIDTMRDITVDGIVLSSRVHQWDGGASLTVLIGTDTGMLRYTRVQTEQGLICRLEPI